jgi:hypothetical protein
MTTEAVLAMAAERRQARDHVVAGLNIGNHAADRLHDAC